jgi:hypothetical protein
MFIFKYNETSSVREYIMMMNDMAVKFKGKEHMRCLLKRSIYGLKWVSRQWYLKFDQVISEFEFKKNTIID